MDTYFVSQATGWQSLYVIRHLLARAAKVHALVRDPAKVPPALKEPGVTLFKGKSKNVDDVVAAARGCRGGFVNTVPIPGLEAQQAQSLVEGLRQAGAGHVVASTSFFTGARELWDNDVCRDIGLTGYFESKEAVERAVRGWGGGSGTYTILRPAFIHFNYMLPHASGNFPTLHSRGELLHSYDEDARMPQTAAHDVGAYAAAALLDPARFAGEEIDIQTEALTIEECRRVVARVSGREVTARKRTPEEVEEAKPSFFTQRFFLWINAFRPRIPEDKLRATQERFGIPFTTLEEALTRDKAGLLECLPA